MAQSDLQQKCCVRWNLYARGSEWEGTPSQISGARGRREACCRGIGDSKYYKQCAWRDTCGWTVRWRVSLSQCAVKSDSKSTEVNQKQTKTWLVQPQPYTAFDRTTRPHLSRRSQFKSWQTQVEKSHGRRNGISSIEWSLGVGRAATKLKDHWQQMGFQEKRKSRCRWRSGEIQGPTGCSRLHSEVPSRLRRDFQSCCSLRIHQICYSLGGSTQASAIPDGHIHCLPPWRTRRRNVHEATRSVPWAREGTCGMSTKTLHIRSETITTL